jgi:hypothetical protein
MARLTPHPVKTFAIGFADEPSSTNCHTPRSRRVYITEHANLLLSLI